MKKIIFIGVALIVFISCTKDYKCTITVSTSIFSTVTEVRTYSEISKSDVEDIKVMNTYSSNGIDTKYVKHNKIL